MYLTNAFSLNMVKPVPGGVTIHARPVTVQDVRDIYWGTGYRYEAPGLASAVGHADTAALFSNILAFPVTPNRISIELDVGDQLVVGQYRGPRLAEGATELPDGATIGWYVITIAQGKY